MLSILALAPACRDTPEVVLHTAEGRLVRVAVELAVTQSERARGLMYRPRLPEGHGMLFVFPREEPHAFWMKNTFFPLDLLFIASDGRIVAIAASAEPLSEKPLGASAPSRYVLEVPGGFCARNGVRVGDRIELPPLGAGGES